MIQRILKGADSLMSWIVFIGIAATPLLIAGGFSSPFLPVKQVFLSGLSFLLLLVLSVKVFLSKEVLLHRTALDRSAFVLLLALFASVVFGEKANGFFGRSDYFVLSLLNLSVFIFFAWNIVQNTTTIRRWQRLIIWLMMTGGMVSAIFVINSLSGQVILRYFGSNLWNNIDYANTNFGTFAATIFLVSYGILMKRDLDTTGVLLSSAVGIISLLAILMIGFKTIAGLTAFGLLLFSGLAWFFKNEIRKNFLFLTLGLAVLMIAVSIFGTPKSLRANIPAEAALGLRPSWNITSSALFSGVKPFVVGTGPGTFRFNFSEFRDSSFNNDNLLATIRFNYPANSFLAVLGESGVVFALAFLVLMLSVFLHLFHALKEVKKGPLELDKIENGFLDLESVANHPQALSTFAIAVPWAVLTVGMAFMFYGFVLWFLWWTLLASLIVGLALFKPGIIRLESLDLRELLKRPYSTQLSVGFSAVLIIAASVFNFRFHLSDRFFAAALASGDYELAEKNLEKAIRLRPHYDIYHAALGRVLFNHGAAESKNENPDLKKLSELLGAAIKEAKRSTELSPRSVALWENLGDMYEGASVLVPDAGEWAIRSIEKARELEPSNHLLAERLGKAYDKSGNAALAIQQLEDAIELKKDYLPAYSLISDLYEKQKEPDRAIITFESALQASPDNVDTRYNYGRLIYNRNRKGDRELAEQIWLAIVEENPNYSNALFSLGLVNELKGKKQTALEYYYQVRDLNPDNQEVVAKIRKLER